jgi:hypothetical protein
VKRIIILMLILTIILSGCLPKEVIEVRNYYENKGYITCTVRFTAGNSTKGAYGYISPDIIDKFKQGEDINRIEVFHPYEKNKSVIVDGSKITAILVNQ